MLRWLYLVVRPVTGRQRGNATPGGLYAVSAEMNPAGSGSSSSRLAATREQILVDL
jgi:hypothetical protein